MSFVNRNDIKIGTQLVVFKPSKGINGGLLSIIGKDGLKDEPLLLTVHSFSKRDFMARDRYGIPHYFSQKTGKCSGQEDTAQVATEAHVAEIRAIQDYNRKVTAIRLILRDPGVHWDAVIELFCKQPTLLPFGQAIPFLE